MIERTRHNWGIVACLGTAVALFAIKIVLDFRDEPESGMAPVTAGAYSQTEVHHGPSLVPRMTRGTASKGRGGVTKPVVRAIKKAVRPSFGFNWGHSPDSLAGYRMSCCGGMVGPLIKTYEGEMVDGKKEGTFRIYWGGRLREEGRFRAGQRIGEWRGFRNTGTVAYQTHYRNGLQHGRFLEFGEDGSIIEDGCFAKGRKTGSWTLWWGVKNPRRRQFFDEETGLKQGQVTMWFANGRKHREGEYHRNQPHGLWRDFHENGAVAEEGTYDFGRCVGTFRRWYDNGELAYTGRFHDNRAIGVHQWWNQDGKRLAVSELKDGCRHGRFRMWHPTGQASRDEHYNEGDFHGMHCLWNEAGICLEKSEYRHDQRHGIEKIWNEEGVQVREAHYKNDQSHGWIRTWYDNGLPKELYFAQSGEMEGVFSSWYESGHLEIQENFRDGLRFGAARMWHENGKLARLNHYDEGELHGASYHWDDTGRMLSRHSYEAGEMIEWLKPE